MKDDIIINKSETIKRCIERIKEEYDNKVINLQNYTKQDSIILNLQRLCEATIDLAMHLIRVNQWEIPQSSKEGFAILEKHGIMNKELSISLQNMTGFRNIAVHDYQSINLKIVQIVIENHLKDPLEYVKAILKHCNH